MSNNPHRTWHVIGWSAFGVALATAAAWFLWDRGTRRAFDAAIARADAAGMPHDFARLDAWLDLQFGPLPPSSNGAPALRQALAAVRRLEDQLPAARLVFGATDPPAIDHAVRELVGDHAEVYVELRRTLQAERYRFDVDWHRGLEAETPFELGYVPAFELLALHVAVHVADHDLDAALDDVRAHVALGESLREVARPLEQVLRVQARVEADRALRTVLLLADDPPGAVAAAGIEPVVDGFRAAIATEASLVAHATTALLGAASEATLAAVLLPAVRDDLADLIDVLTTTYALASELTPDRLATIQDLEAAYGEHAGLVGGMLATRCSALLRHELTQRGELMLTAAGAEALAFRIREHRWPGPEELRSRPLDPLSGGALSATVDGDALVLRLGEAEWRLEPRR